MRIKILMVTDEPVSVVSDIQLLTDNQFLVYTCFNPDNINDMISELLPDVIFINPMKNSPRLSETYNSILTNLSFINIPVIYTLSEDDVYLVTRKRTITKRKRTLIADNIVDAIRSSLQKDTHIRVHSRQDKNDLNPPSFQARA